MPNFRRYRIPGKRSSLCEIVTDKKNLDRFQRVQVLGGKEYVERVRAAFAGSIVDIETPLAGLRIGEAMHKVKTAVDEATIMS